MIRVVQRRMIWARDKMLKTRSGSERVEFGHRKLGFRPRERRLAGRVTIEQIALVGMLVGGMCLAIR
jgi:hypothetical protein